MPTPEMPTPRWNDDLLTEEQKEIKEAVDALYKRLKY
jgi:hypothetical protein